MVSLHSLFGLRLGVLGIDRLEMDLLGTGCVPRARGLTFTGSAA